MATDGIVIERSAHAQEFVIIGNTEARDTRLSFRARGLHHHLLSLPSGWRVTTTDLAKDNPEGRDAIRTALNELIRLGYVTKAKRQDARGRWTTTMTVHDKPQESTSGEPGAVTEDGFPGVGESGAIQKTVTKDGEDQKKAPRRARTSGAGDLTDAQTILDDVRRAAHKAYPEDTGHLTDEDCMRIYRRFCCDKDGTPRKIAVSVYAYLTGGPFKDVPTIDEALKPPQRRDGIPFDVQLRYGDPETTDEERTEIVEDLIDGFGPGEEPAAEAMIMRNESLGYIVRTLTSGQMHRAA